MKSMIRAVCAALLLMLAMVPIVPVYAADAPVSDGYGSTISVSTSWADLIVPYGAMASTPAFVHNLGTTRLVVFFTASASAPTAGGIVLKPGETMTGSAAHVWVRSLDATGAVTVGRVTGIAATDASGNASSISKGSASLATGQISIGTSSTLLVAARTGRAKLIASVGAANTCAFGTNGVTTTTGFPLQPTAGASLMLDTAAAVYAACSATTTVSYIEQF